MAADERDMEIGDADSGQRFFGQNLTQGAESRGREQVKIVNDQDGWNRNAQLMQEFSCRFKTRGITGIAKPLKRRGDIGRFRQSLPKPTAEGSPKDILGYAGQRANYRNP
jgi:hypothetical protein